MSPVMSFQHDDDHHQQQQQQQQRKIVRPASKEYQINGARPAPLQLRKSSHVIHKASSASSSSSSVSTACSSSAKHHHHRSSGPVIIYTQSPRVIHTQPRDFMALVQKLTGLSSSEEQQTSSSRLEMGPPVGVLESGSGAGPALNSDYRSMEKFDDGDRTRFMMSEIPLFTPTGLDVFRSPPPPMHHQQQQFRFPGDSIFSPATLEFIKTLPEC